MSSLRDFTHHEMHDKPNDVHNISEENQPDTDKKADKKSILAESARRRIEAMNEGHMRPSLYYTQQEQKITHDTGVWESESTVASKLKSKEEFPQG